MNMLTSRFISLLSVWLFLTSLHFCPIQVKAAERTNSSYSLTGLKQILKTGENYTILVYDETSEFTHNSRDAARVMFKELGDAHGFFVEYDRSGDAFNTVENLQKYAVVVFSNTSGNTILNETQKNNFEKYIKDGGSFLGIHAATDTYRSGWNWYRDLVGGSVRTNPHHTDQNFPGTMDVLDPDHPATKDVPDPWSRNEEWYYWKGGGGYLYSGNINLLQLRATGDNDYDEARPISWYKEYDGGRSFYTAMGHANTVYSEVHFKNHILGALQWLTEKTETPADPNPPTLDPIDDPEPIAINSGIQTITLTGISAGSGASENITLSAQSDNTELIPHPEINYDGNGSTAKLSFQPLPEKHGTANITVTIDNGEENQNTTEQTFSIIVVQSESQLTVSEIEDVSANKGDELEPIPFSITYDGDEDIEISISSSNQELIPIENIHIEGDGRERTINIAPVSGQLGESKITVTVKAGNSEVVEDFVVTIFELIVAIDKPSEKRLKLYPNPVDGEAFLQIEEGIYNISVLDFTGKKVLEIKDFTSYNSNPIPVNFEKLSPGTYILFINQRENIYKKKILIR